MRYILTMFCIFLFIGCSLENTYYPEYANHKLHNFNTDMEPIEFIQANVAPLPDVVDEWSNPENTVNRGYGDCEDFAILYMNLLYFQTGEVSSLIIVETTSGQHAIINYKGEYIEPQIGSVYSEPRIIKIYTFWEVFK